MFVRFLGVRVGQSTNLGEHMPLQPTYTWMKQHSLGYVSKKTNISAVFILWHVVLSLVSYLLGWKAVHKISSFYLLKFQNSHIRQFRYFNDIDSQNTEHIIDFYGGTQFCLSVLFN